MVLAVMSLAACCAGCITNADGTTSVDTDAIQAVTEAVAALTPLITNAASQIAAIQLQIEQAEQSGEDTDYLDTLLQIWLAYQQSLTQQKAVLESGATKARALKDAAV
jgi:hypothetical protein